MSINTFLPIVTSDDCPEIFEMNGLDRAYIELIYIYSLLGKWITGIILIGNGLEEYLQHLFRFHRYAVLTETKCPAKLILQFCWWLGS